MFNFNRILRNYGLARAPRRHYGRWGGGAALPLLGMLAYRYREPIMKFVRERFGKRDVQHHGYSSPGTHTA
jgi:hypothetical protein